MDYDGDIDLLLKVLEANGIFGGVKVGEHTLMLAVTEKRTREEIEQLVKLAAL